MNAKTAMNGVGKPANQSGARPILCLVEDNPDNADLVTDLLSDRYAIVHFPDAPSALRALKAMPRVPNVFLLDISLPGMDGVALLRTLRQDARLVAVPAIALTAHAMKNEREQLLAAGCGMDAGSLFFPMEDE